MNPALRRERVCLLLQPGSLDTDRQVRAALGYTDREALELIAVTTNPGAAVAMVASGEVRAVVVTHREHGAPLDAIESRIIACGGRLEVVRREPRRLVDLAGLVGRLAAKGMEAPEISDLLGVPLAHVVRVLGDGRPTRTA